MGGGIPPTWPRRRAYSGVNPLIWLLRLHAQKYGLRSRWFGSFAQWKAVGCSVKPRPAGVEPGRWGASVILYKPLKKKEIDKKTGEEIEVEIPLLRTFNGTVRRRSGQRGRTLAGHGRTCQRRLHRFRTRRNGSLGLPCGRAIRRRPGLLLGQRRLYPDAAQGTDSPRRRNITAPWPTRWLITANPGSAGRGIMPSENSGPKSHRPTCWPSLANPRATTSHKWTAYVKSWLKSLRDDVSFIFKASSAASKAADHILSYSRPKEDVEQPSEALACC